MPGMEGIEATQMITAGNGATRVLVLTTFDDAASRYRMFCFALMAMVWPLRSARVLTCVPGTV